MKSLLKHSRYFFWQHNFQRKNYNVITPSDLDYFRTILPSRSIITDKQILQNHNVCWRRIDRGHSQLMLCPSNSQQVSQVLKYCNDRRLAVVPQGGNTGLVGGSVPVFDQIIVNLRNLNKIEGFNEVSSVVTCQSGVILQKLNQFLHPYGFQTPLDLGAKGSCQIGGNASTNAGGKYVVKYGSFRSHILGLEAVVPTGQILDLTSEIHKDNTGYDLKHLFIGGQGTLGIITKLNIMCQKIDNVRKIMVFKTDKFDNILKSLPIIKKNLGKKLAALQYMDGVTYQTVIRHLHPSVFQTVNPTDHILFLQSSTQQLDSLFEQLDFFNDSVMSNSDKEYFNIWKIREDAAVAAARQKGHVLAYDISFDVREWPTMLQYMRKATGQLVMGYGHIGDGNLHVNIILPEGKQFAEKYLFEEVTKKKGSISAEHGVGLHKPPFLSLQKSPKTLDLYRGIRKLFDPNGILNPYKVIPE